MTGTESDDESATDHLDEIPDGSGCTEIWEHLSERRDGETDTDGADDE